MLIAALVLAVIGLAALVTAVVTSYQLIAWVCIGASVLGVLLLIVDALRERSRRDDEGDDEREDDGNEGEDEGDESVESGDETAVIEDYPEDVTSEANSVPADDVTAANALAEDAADDDPGTSKG